MNLILSLIPLIIFFIILIFYSKLSKFIYFHLLNYQYLFYQIFKNQSLKFHLFYQNLKNKNNFIYQLFHQKILS